MHILRSKKVGRNPANSDFGTLGLHFQRDVDGLEIADMSSTDEAKSERIEKTASLIHVNPNLEQ